MERPLQEVTIVLPSLIGLYTAEPVVAELLRRGVTVHMACPTTSTAEVRRRFPDLSGDIIDLDAVRRGHRWLVRAHGFARLALTDRDLSIHYRLLTDPRRRGATRGRRAAIALNRVAGRWRSAQVNRFLERLGNTMTTNPFPTSRVVAVSLATAPELLCARGQSVLTLMESWDHPTKVPAGYITDTIVAWNNDLADDWIRHQGAGATVLGFPIKLRYAVEHAAASAPMPRQSPPWVMYPAGTSSLTEIDSWYESEYRLIEDLCRASARAGWRLLIKPKPNGPSGDFDEFARRYDHVEIGRYQDGSGGGNYYLDADYNSARMKELNRVDLVINCWTTFAFDAALAGKPVLQLDLRGSEQYPRIANALSNYHLDRYVLRDPSTTYSPEAGETVEDVVARALADVDHRPDELSKRLRDWLIPGHDLPEAVDRICSAILDGAETRAS